MISSLGEFRYALRHPMGRRGHFLSCQMERHIGQAVMTMAYSCLAGAAGVVVLSALKTYPKVIDAHGWMFTGFAVTTLILLVVTAIAACITGGLSPNLANARWPDTRPTIRRNDNHHGAAGRKHRHPIRRFAERFPLARSASASHRLNGLS